MEANRRISHYKSDTSDTRASNGAQEEMLSTWTRTVLMLYIASELHGFVPAPAGLCYAQTLCPTGGWIALRVNLHREDSKANLLKLLESQLNFDDVVSEVKGANHIIEGKKCEVESDVVSKLEGAMHMIEDKRREMESDVACKVEGAIVTIWILEGKKREVERDMVSKIEGAKQIIEGKKREVASEVVSKLEGAKHMIESKKRQVENELGSAAERMFMRFDAFRSKVATEDENAKQAFERFDQFMKKSETQSADQ